MFVENQLTINTWVYFWILNSIPLIYMSVLNGSNIVLITVAFQWVLKLSMHSPTFSRLFLLFWVLWISIWIIRSACPFLQRGQLGFWYELLWSVWGSKVILTVLSLLIHEYQVSFHLFRCLTYFNNVLWFSLHKPCISSDKFIPKYFILFEAIINGIVLLISFQIIHC